jgi:signal transduction histidine kinase
MVEIRTLSFELSPPVLYDLGLPDALSWLTEDVERRYGIKVELADDESQKPLGHVAAALVFRAIRELLTNVFKHAKCPACTVSMRRDGADLHIEVRDHGTGFDVYGAEQESPGRGFGLSSVREQISRIGGQVAVASALGKGTRVSLRVPLKTDEASA